MSLFVSFSSTICFSLLLLFLSCQIHEKNSQSTPGKFCNSGYSILIIFRVKYKTGSICFQSKAHRLWTSLAVWWRIVYFLLDFWRHLKCLSKQIAEVIERQRHYFANKGPSSQGYGFSSGHVWM